MAIKGWWNRLFKESGTSTRIIYFSTTKDIHLIGRTVVFFNRTYIIEDVIRVSWLKLRGKGNYVPLYAVKGKMMGGSEECVDKSIDKEG